MSDGGDHFNSEMFVDEIGEVDFRNHVVRQLGAIDRSAGDRRAAAVRQHAEGADADQEGVERVVDRRVDRGGLGRGKVGRENGGGDGGQQGGREGKAEFVFHGRHSSFKSFGLAPIAAFRALG